MKKTTDTFYMTQKEQKKLKHSVKRKTKRFNYTCFFIITGVLVLISAASITAYFNNKPENFSGKLLFMVPVVLLSAFIFGSAIRNIVLHNYITAFVFMVFSCLIYGSFPIIFELQRNSVIDVIIFDVPLFAGGFSALFCFFKLAVFTNMFSPFKSLVNDVKKGYYDFDDEDIEDNEE